MSRSKRKPSEEDMLRKNVKYPVVFSPFITTDLSGEINFHTDPPCPRCYGWMDGEYAGSFSCGFCGFDSYPKYSSPHGTSLLLEGTWTFFRFFIPNKRLRWLVSRQLYRIHSDLMNWYRLGRHRVSITDGDYMWDWEKKRWFKFM